MPRLEFFFDCSSPWTYLGFHAVQTMANRLAITIEWRPILVGGVFNAVNPQLYEARASMMANEQRLAHYQKDLQDWARFYNITICQPSVFPVNSVKVMRGCCAALERGKLVPFARHAFEAYWGDDQDISQDSVIENLCLQAGLEPTEIFARISSQPCKDELRANTEELVQRGGYGSPTLFIDGDDMYFGNDRLVLVEHALKARL
mgnify:CR=1 FL=1